MAKRVIVRMDADKDGTLSFDEMPGQQTQQDRMFSRLDADGEGLLAGAASHAVRDAGAAPLELGVGGHGQRPSRALRRSRILGASALRTLSG